MSVHHNITMPDAPESSDVCQNGNQNHAASQPPDIACKAGNHRSNSGNDNALRTLHETYLALNIQTLGTGTDKLTITEPIIAAKVTTPIQNQVISPCIRTKMRQMPKRLTSSL